MMAAGKPHLVRKSRFLAKSTDAKKPREKSSSNEQGVACSHSNTNKSNFNQENNQVIPKLNQIVDNKPIQAHIDVKAIHADTSPTKLTTDNDNTKTTQKTSADTGIFNKISSIWTKRNENTASDTDTDTSNKQQNNKNQSDSFVKSFKKLFKD